MKKICICGSFGFGKNNLDGQTVKTKSIYDELIRIYGENEISTIDTENAKRELFKYPIILFHAVRQHENIIILPAHNGVRIISPILALVNLLYKRKLHYVVVGGWLPSFISNRKYLKKCLSTFTGIYVETNTMREALHKKNLNNVYVMKNFKHLNIVSSNELHKTYEEPYRLCTFSRVMKKKGIEDAIIAIDSINKEFNKEIFSLSIYGQVEKDEEPWFRQIIEDCSSYIKYKGKVDYGDSVQTLSDYFALLFPTKFYTEGIPGTIIDAYSAGVPVISSRWESFYDVIDENITGLGYEFNSIDDLKNVLRKIANNPRYIIDKKEACILKAQTYSADDAMKVLLNNF